MCSVMHIVKVAAVHLIFLLTISVKIESVTGITAPETSDLTEPTLAEVGSGKSDAVNFTTLRMVQVVFRHGDRSPVSVYPNDLHKDVAKYWPLGLGQLTELGEEQHYDLGSYFRHRYDGFLNARYLPKEIYVLSSDVDRTLMSAEAHIAGLYPKINHTKNASSDGLLESDAPSEFSEKVGMQLVPIHTVTAENDRLLHMKEACPRKSQAEREFYATSPEYIKLKNENDDFIKFAENKFGMPHNEDRTIFFPLKIHDALFCQRAHNLTLPEWANSTVMAKMERLRGIGFKMDYGGTLELKRLKGGPLVQRMVNNVLSFQMEQNAEASSLKMHVFSAHDDTIAAVLSAMNIFDPQVPSYASAFIFELHQRPEGEGGEYFVNLFYRNSSKVDPYPLQLPGCEISCPLSTLQTLLEPVIPVNWEDECQLKNYGWESHSSEFWMETSLYTILILCLVGLVIASAFIFILIYSTSFGAQKLRLMNINNDKASYIPI